MVMKVPKDNLHFEGSDQILSQHYVLVLCDNGKTYILIMHYKIILITIVIEIILC